MSACKRKNLFPIFCAFYVLQVFDTVYKIQTFLGKDIQIRAVCVELLAYGVACYVVQCAVDPAL